MLLANILILAASACSFASASSLPRGDGAALQSRAQVGGFVAIINAYTPVTAAIQVCHQKVTQVKSVEEVVVILKEFQQKLNSVVGTWGQPCGCTADAGAAASFNAQLQTWFSELQAIIQDVSSKFPGSYKQYCAGIFSSIGAAFQTAIRPAVDAGVDVGSFVGGLGLNANLFAGVNIQVSSFTKASKTTTSSSSSSSSSSISAGGGFIGQPHV